MAAQIVKNLKSSKVEEFRKSKAKTWTILRKEDLLDTLKSSRKYINKCLDSIAVMCAKENEKAERIHEKLEMTACYWVMFEEALAHYEALPVLTSELLVHAHAYQSRGKSVPPRV